MMNGMLTPTSLPADDLAQIDLDGFARELEALYARLVAQFGQEDLRHLRKLERWGRICSVLGYGTAWMAPNPFSALLMSTGNVTRWALMNHHISHRAYDRVPGVPPRYTSKVFAKGWRRWIDWPDWLVPAGWNFEHNTLHHYHTGEPLDPDVLEDRARLVRHPKMPRWLSYPIAAAVICSWKLSYYAPNTLWMLQLQRSRPGREGLKQHVGDHQPLIFHGLPLWNPFSRNGWEFWRRCVLPYGAFRFALLPALFLPLGAVASLNVFLNSLLAELFANVHSFLIIAPNHSGDDLYCYEAPIAHKAEFYVRQIMGSVNYTGGSDWADFLQGWLNYQIEHHMWPDLPLLRLRQAQPEVEALCHKYGVPYLRQPLYKRVWQTLRLMGGRTRQPRIERLPQAVPRKALVSRP